MNGVAEGDSQAALVDNDAALTEYVVVGDLLHNIDDGSVGEIEAVTDTTLTVRNGMVATKRGVPHAESNGDGERYWVESEMLKNPSSIEEGYYGYFVPTAHYDYSSNVFVRDDDNGEWSGNFLNWLTMRRGDIARKVMMGGLATSRTGSGNQHLIGEDPALWSRQYPKIPYQDDLVSNRHTPYDNTHFYRIVGGSIKVYELQDGYEFDFTGDFTYQSDRGKEWPLNGGAIMFVDDGLYTVGGIIANEIRGTADGMTNYPTTKTPYTNTSSSIRIQTMIMGNLTMTSWTWSGLDGLEIKWSEAGVSRTSTMTCSGLSVLSRRRGRRSSMPLKNCIPIRRMNCFTTCSAMPAAMTAM